MKFALFGAGRIGKIHGGNVAARADCELLYVVDVYEPAAKELAAKYGAKVATVEEALGDTAVDAVIIGSSTDTHAYLIEASAKAGKAIFCEKPIDLDSARVTQCLKVVDECGVDLALGFNRRFDPNFQELKSQMDQGHIGKCELVVLTSRDPGAPPVEYIKVSGGLFRDMMIHDFDVAVWLLGEVPCEVMAYGSCLVNPEIGQVGDIDTAMVMLKTKSGKIAHINNSRRAAYGYDQRIEVHGEKGALLAENVPLNTVKYSGADGIVTAKPLDFFLERYAEAYKRELNNFVEAINAKHKPAPGGFEGKVALLLADAAYKSYKTGQPVQIEIKE